jgi:hypothetical protein
MQIVSEELLILYLNNSVLIGWMKGGLSLESDATYNSLVGTTTTSEFKNNLLHANASTYRIGSVLLLVQLMPL